jgi:hypothetical protein
MMSADSTHLFVLYDDGGTITSIGDVNLTEIERQGLGQLTCSAEGRHFAQIALTDEIRNMNSHHEAMRRYFVSYEPGTSKIAISRREST